MVTRRVPSVFAWKASTIRKSDIRFIKNNKGAAVLTKRLVRRDEDAEEFTVANGMQRL